MDINKILDELRQERGQLEAAILSIERLALGGVKRRGRPPAWMTMARIVGSDDQTAGATRRQQEQKKHSCRRLAASQAELGNKPAGSLTIGRTGYAREAVVEFGGPLRLRP